jgi:hypothetical protein
MYIYIGNVMRCMDDGLAYHFLEKFNDNTLSIDEILKLVGNEHYGNIELFKNIDFPDTIYGGKDTVFKRPSIGDNKYVTNDEYLHNIRNLSIDGNHNGNDDYVNMNRNNLSRQRIRFTKPRSADKDDSIEIQLKREWGSKLKKTRRLSKDIQNQSFSDLDKQGGSTLLICNETDDLEFKRNNTVNNLLRSMQHNETLPSLVYSNTPPPPAVSSCEFMYIYVHVYTCMYVCIYMYVHILSSLVYSNTPPPPAVSPCEFMCIYVCMYTYMYVCNCMYVHILPSIVYSNTPPPPAVSSCEFMYIYIHMYTYMYVCNCMYVHILPSIVYSNTPPPPAVSSCEFMYIYIHMYTYMYVSIYMYVHILPSLVYSNTPPPPAVSSCEFMYIYVHMYTYMYVCIYMYVYILPSLVYSNTPPPPAVSSCEFYCILCIAFQTRLVYDSVVA